MSQAVFQVSVQNDPPTAPFPLLPLDGETLYTATPTLQWLDSLDPEGASLTYQVEVYSDKHLTTLVASVSGLPGTLLTTSWQVTPALLEKTTYYWRVRGSDGQLSSAWSGTQSFKVGKLTTGGKTRYFAVKPGGLNGRRVATIGSLGGLTGGETEAIFFYQTDHLGTPLMLTDQTGQVVWQAEYLPFGEPVSINEDVDGDGTNVTNNLRFPGQYADGETGLHYNMARDYQPGIGRYVEADPLGLDGGINTYAYAILNPCRRFDPLGLWSVADAVLLEHFYNGGGTLLDISAWCSDYLADPAVQGQTANLHNQIDDEVKSLVGLRGKTTFSVFRNDPLVITSIFSMARGNTRNLRADCDAEGDGCCVSAKCKLRYYAADRYSDPVRLCDKLGICGDPITGVQNLDGITFWFQLSCSGSTYGSSACAK
jgi:RHS repeat-associated protein